MGYPRDKEPSGLRRLTGQGGVALVMFHLSRQKIDFVATPNDFHLGDLWIAVHDKKYGIEVKTCRSLMKWQISRAQVKKMDYYVLVSMGDARCYVFTSHEMLDVIDASPVIYGDIHLVDKSSIPPSYMNSWRKFGEVHVAEADVVSGVTLSPSILYGPPVTPELGRLLKNKSVRKKLANGMTKIYTYERRAISK